MVAFVGTFGLYVTVFGSLLAAAFWGGAARRSGGGHAQAAGLITAGRQASWVGFAGVAVSVGAMEWALVGNDFSLGYVADHSSRSTPGLYRVTALWSALDGSMLLWLLVLAGYGVLIGRRRRHESRHPASAAPLELTAACVVATVTLAFAVLVVATTAPFARLDPPALDGPGPNPLLADHPAMAIHPPLLYLGYVGLVVPFGYAVAALLVGQAGTAWLGRTRRWLLVSWVCLTAGIALGAWWSYAVLGWGGYWAWDPVENASLLPWLTATALLHAALSARSRPRGPLWLVMLAAASFLLVVTGTFLTRSGVLASVHSFTYSTLGPALLTLTAILAAVVVGLVIWRGDQLRSRSGTEVWRHGRGPALLLNNVLLVGFACTVLIGTLLPLLSGAIGQEVSAGAPYYNRIAVPLGLALLAILVWATVSRWRLEPAATVWLRAWLPIAVGAATVAALGLSGARGLIPVFALSLAAAVVAAATRETWRSLQGHLWRHWWRRRRLIGGHIAHIGLAIVTAGIAASAAWQATTESAVAVGGSLAAGSARAEVIRVEQSSIDGRIRTAVETRLSSGGSVRIVMPALVYYPGHDQTVPVPGIAGNLLGDSYVTVLAVAPDGSSVTLRVTDEPLVGWLWAGAVLMCLGGAAAIGPRRRARSFGAPLRPAAFDVSSGENSAEQLARDPA